MQRKTRLSLCFYSAAKQYFAALRRDLRLMKLAAAVTGTRVRVRVLRGEYPINQQRRVNRNYRHQAAG